MDEVKDEPAAWRLWRRRMNVHRPRQYTASEIGNTVANSPRVTGLNSGGNAALQTGGWEIRRLRRARDPRGQFARVCGERPRQYGTSSGPESFEWLEADCAEVAAVDQCRSLTYGTCVPLPFRRHSSLQKRRFGYMWTCGRARMDVKISYGCNPCNFSTSNVGQSPISRVGCSSPLVWEMMPLQPRNQDFLLKITKTYLSTPKRRRNILYSFRALCTRSISASFKIKIEDQDETLLSSAR